jgi:hypothetical protein
VGHRQLAQHQHYTVQLALWRDVRVDAGLLGRRLLLQCEQRRPNAGVEVHRECNTDTNAEANSDTQGASDSISSPDFASLREMVIGGPSTPISLLYRDQSSLSL